ncbi:MAG: hypothetical protein ABIH89_02780 [Elusimicrobiota bacterium]
MIIFPGFLIRGAEYCMLFSMIHLDGQFQKLDNLLSFYQRPIPRNLAEEKTFFLNDPGRFTGISKKIYGTVKNTDILFADDLLSTANDDDCRETVEAVSIVSALEYGISAACTLLEEDAPLVKLHFSEKVYSDDFAYIKPEIELTLKKIYNKFISE